METKNKLAVKRYNLKINGNDVKLFISLKKPYKDKTKFVVKLVNGIPYQKDTGFAGFKSKEALIKFLLWSIYNSNTANYKWTKISLYNIVKEIKKTLHKCNYLVNWPLYIYIFPTLSNFVIKKMKGVSGYSPFKNTIVLNIFPNKQWKNVFDMVLLHELSHTLMPNYYRKHTLLGTLVLDGVAEHFAEYFSFKKSILVKLSKKEAKKIFNKIRLYLKNKNRKLNIDLFYGTGKYPLWAGYAVGYYLVDSYIRSANWNWKKIFYTPFSTFLKEGDF